MNRPFEPIVQHDWFRIDKRPPARYRVHREARANWQILDRETGLKTYAGETWQHAIEGVRARYDRLQRAAQYMTIIRGEPADPDETTYTPGSWANG